MSLMQCPEMVQSLVMCHSTKDTGVLVSQSCATLYSPIDCIQPGSSVHGILQARILEWIATPFSRGPSQPRDRNWVPYIAGRFFTVWTKGKPMTHWTQIIHTPCFNWMNKWNDSFIMYLKDFLLAFHISCL